VKKVIILSFIFLYLTAYTELSQFFKIPVMIEHFTEHKKHNTNITFFKFLAAHYIYGDGNENDNERDARLPFKSHNSNVVNVLFSDFLSNSFVIIPPVKIVSACYIPEQELFESSYLSAIWQPPKIS
jgi:hypothetical protein